VNDPASQATASQSEQINGESDDQQLQLMDQMLMMSANQVLTSAQEQQKQKAKLKSKSTVKMKTFYGGEEIKDVSTLIKEPVPVNVGAKNTTTTSNTSASSIDYFNFEFVGAGVKLEKSILILNSSSSSSLHHNNNNNNNSQNINVRSRKTNRVNFTDIAETYEYPSFEFLLKEMGIDPDEDQEEDNERENGPRMLHLSSVSTFSSSSSSFSQFLPGRSSSTDDDDDEDDGVDADESSDYNSTMNKNSIYFSGSENGLSGSKVVPATLVELNGDGSNDSNNNLSSANAKFSKLGNFNFFFFFPEGLILDRDH
jgi:hypothetical protein